MSPTLATAALNETATTTSGGGAGAGICSLWLAGGTLSGATVCVKITIVPASAGQIGTIEGSVEVRSESKDVATALMEADALPLWLQEAAAATAAATATAANGATRVTPVGLELRVGDEIEVPEDALGCDARVSLAVATEPAKAGIEKQRARAAWKALRKAALDA